MTQTLEGFGSHEKRANNSLPPYTGKTISDGKVTGEERWSSQERGGHEKLRDANC